MQSSPRETYGRSRTADPTNPDSNLPEGPVRLTSAASKPVRVFLFKRPFADAFHLRLAIGMSLLQCDVQVLERADQGMRTACAITKCGPPLPGLVLVEDEGGGEAASFERRLRRSEIGDLPLAVLGDGADPGCRTPRGLRREPTASSRCRSAPPSSRGWAATSRGSGRTIGRAVASGDTSAA
jgi:hypothetical protein